MSLLLFASVLAGPPPDPYAALAGCPLPPDLACVSASVGTASGWSCTFTGEDAKASLNECPAWSKFIFESGGLSMRQESRRQAEGWSTRWWLTGPAQADPALVAELERLLSVAPPR